MGECKYGCLWATLGWLEQTSNHLGYPALAIVIPEAVLQSDGMKITHQASLNCQEQDLICVHDHMSASEIQALGERGTRLEGQSRT